MGTDAKKEEVYQDETLMKEYQKYITFLYVSLSKYIAILFCIKKCSRRWNRTYHKTMA